jgi:hypothetical protein
MDKREAEIIAECLRNLKRLDACQAEFTPLEHPVGQSGELSLRGPWGAQSYQVVTCQRVSAASTEVVIHQLKARHVGQPVLLFSDYLSREVGARLRQAGIHYVDTAGNAHLVSPPLYLDISGRKRPLQPLRAGRAFQLAGLKLLYLLLRTPEASRWTHRALARESGIALGAVGAILQELNEFAQLEHPSGQQLLARHELLSRWQLGYGERLRPKLFLQRCRCSDDISTAELCQLIGRNRLAEQVLIGGELGASLLLQTASAETATLHLAGDPLRCMLQLHLVPDAKGPVALVSQFGRANHWQGRQPDGLMLADPLLLQAELLTREAADQALANLLYKHYLEPRLAGELYE